MVSGRRSDAQVHDVVAGPREHGELFNKKPLVYALPRQCFGGAVYDIRIGVDIALQPGVQSCC